jgi:isopropylmalate/homocitrate/citramalate synthase
MITDIEESIEFSSLNREYQINDVKEPNLFREIFPYDRICKVPFGNKIIPPMPAELFRLSDTTFRDGQQARPPYTVEQVGTIFDFLHRLSGPNGLITHSEFFLYTSRDREAVELCRSRDYRFPRITAWIRANKKDFELVREMELDETGILASVSDYHIFMKMNKTRGEALKEYLDITEAALEAGIVPRLHFEDITRADIYGFVVPFVQKLVRLSEQASIPVKIRLCDTMGYGVTYPMAALPRSVPRLIRAVIDDGGIPGELLEWHGHNDFHRGFTNATYAWLYGCENVNATLLGFGERTGNTPLEAMVIEYIGLTGDDQGIDTTAITDMAHYFESIGFQIPDNYPFVGSDFNVTRAGVHVDGIMKNEEIYNIFNTEKILKKPLGIGITDKSGVSGVARWVNSHLGFTGGNALDKKDPGVVRMHARIMKEYEKGRITAMSNEELEMMARKYLPLHFISEFDRIRMREQKQALTLLSGSLAHGDIISMDPKKQERVLQDLVESDPYICFAYVVDKNGHKVTRHITQITEKSKYDRNLIDTDYSDRDWFINVMRTGKTHVSDIFVSKVTGKLSITVSGPITDAGENIVGVLGLDIRFEELAKLEDGEKAQE